MNKKRILKASYLASLLGVCSLIIYAFPREDLKSDPPKMTHAKSYQKIIKEEHNPTNKSKDKKLINIMSANRLKARVSTSLPRRSMAQRESRGNPSGAFLTTSLSGYDFNESILAVNKKNYRGNQQDILGEIQGMLVIKTNTPPSGSLSLIKKENEDRVGLYMGKIVLIHKQDDKLENEISAIVGDPGTISHVSGVYIIESPKIADSIQLLTNLKEKFKNTQIDLDINYSRNEAK